MRYFNLHTHTRFSDGSDSPEEYVKEAVRQGFSTLGFTDHSPVPFPNTFALHLEKLGNYCQEISDLKKKYTSQSESGIDILLGLEIDYIPGITTPIADYRRDYPFDYVIGSVHLIRNPGVEGLWFIDGPERSLYQAGLTDVFGGDARAAVTAYFRQLQEMIAHHTPDIVGHIDKVKMYNRGDYFSEEDSWYRSLVNETLDLVKENGCVVEINTRGLYKKRSESLFPGIEILKKIVRMDIPVTLCSDAHKPHELSLLFPETLQQLRELGFKSLACRTVDGWKEVALVSS
jgi:histidinol-phosphatase (PHP family)